MNAQIQSQVQPPFQPQVLPQQQQNVGQARQGQQGFQNSGQQKGNSQASYATYDPQLSNWILQKPKNATSWEDAQPLQQHVALQSLQEDLEKFKRSGSSVKRVLKEIPSENARRLVNDLVNDQNKILNQWNRSIQWTIASVELEWKSLNRRERRLKSIEVILKTEPRGFVEPNKQKTGAHANALDFQDPTRVPKQNGMAKEFVGHGSAQNNPNQSQHHGNNGQHQFADHQSVRIPGQGNGHAQVIPPPPPPPPNSGGHAQGQGIPIPPPPPPPPPPQVSGGAVKQHQQPQPQQHLNMLQQGMPMNGPFQNNPEQLRMPKMGHKQQKVQPIEILDPNLLRQQKSKTKSLRREYVGRYAGMSDESDSSSSGSESLSAVSIEDGTYGFIDRSRSSSRKKVHSRSHSRRRSISRGRERMPRMHKEKLSHVRRHSIIDPPPIGKYSRDSPKGSPRPSPRNSSAALPPIHIHMNTPTATAKEPERDWERDRARDRETRRSIHNSSPNSLHKETYSRLQKMSSHPMSRGSSLDHGSDTASFGDGTSSIYTADDSVFSEPVRRVHSRNNSRPQSVITEATGQVPSALRSRNLPRHAEPHGYDSLERRPKGHYAADDYPYYDEPYAQQRPAMHPRRHSAMAPNPFSPTHFPPNRSHTLDHMSEASYGYAPSVPGTQGPRYITDRAHPQDSITMDDMFAAVEHIQQTRRQAPPPPPLYRRNTMNSRAMPRDTDEWANPSYMGHRVHRVPAMGGGYM